jgi:hypothetical protein
MPKRALTLLTALGLGTFIVPAPAQTRPSSEFPARAGFSVPLNQPPQSTAPDLHLNVPVVVQSAPLGAGDHHAGFQYTPGNVTYKLDTWGPGTDEEAKLAPLADQLVRQLGEAKSDADRDKLKSQLGELLDKQFDLRQKRHEKEIAGLEAQLKKLKDLVQKRQENRRDIVAKRLEQVLRDAQGLGW